MQAFFSFFGNEVTYTIFLWLLQQYETTVRDKTMNVKKASVKAPPQWDVGDFPYFMFYILPRSEKASSPKIIIIKKIIF